MPTYTKKLQPTEQTKSVSSSMQGQAFSKQSPAVHSILQLQRTVGNRAVQELLLSSLQVQHRVMEYQTVLRNVTQDTANAARRALRSFADFSGISEPPGIQVVDLLAIVLQSLPFAGPIARLLKDNLVGSAAVAMLRETTVRTTTRIESHVEGSRALSAAEARAEFIASSASDFDEMQRTMENAILEAVVRYNRAIEAGRTDLFRMHAIYTELEKLIKENQGLTRSHYDTLAERLELSLYRAYYAPKVYILELGTLLGVFSREIINMPSAVQGRIVRLLHGHWDVLYEELRSWGVQVKTIVTRGGQGIQF